MALRVIPDENQPSAAIEIPLEKPLPDYDLFQLDQPTPRDVDAILVTHAHFDHIGNLKLAQDPNSPQAPCAPGPGFGSDATPFSNVAFIAAAKNSAVIAGSPLSAFLGFRIAQLLGTTATPACAATSSTDAPA